MALQSRFVCGCRMSGERKHCQARVQATHSRSNNMAKPSHRVECEYWTSRVFVSIRRISTKQLIDKSVTSVYIHIVNEKGTRFVGDGELRLF